MARYLFTSKFGGNSTGNFAGLNLGDHVGDSPESVAQNRKFLREYLALENLIFMDQTHSADVFTVEQNPPTRIEADALITSERSMGLAVLTADCIPLLIDAGDYIAAVHVGRKGLVGGIIPKTLAILAKQGAKAKNAWIGPSICGECYEVSMEMYQDVIADFPAAATSPLLHSLDLPAAATAQLQAAGVLTHNLHRCTLESEHHYSYRGQSVTGRLAGVISL